PREVGYRGTLARPISSFAVLAGRSYWEKIRYCHIGFSLHSGLCWDCCCTRSWSGELLSRLIDVLQHFRKFASQDRDCCSYARLLVQLRCRPVSIGRQILLTGPLLFPLLLRWGYAFQQAGYFPFIGGSIRFSRVCCVKITR